MSSGKTFTLSNGEITDTFTDLILIEVEPGTVKVTVANVEGSSDGGVLVSSLSFNSLTIFKLNFNHVIWKDFHIEQRGDHPCRSRIPSPTSSSLR
jgi:MinD-like ATPase involved in chromosome partitioning or flagellar assembly